MPIEIVVPRLGWSMDEGTFAGWLISPGTMVNAGDHLFLLEGEKATQDVESFDQGLLCVPEDAPRTGDTVMVGQVLGYLLLPDEVAPTHITRDPQNPGSSSVPSAPTPLPPDPTDASIDSPSFASEERSGGSAGPAVRRLARTLGIDVHTIRGTGPRGRILIADVHHAAVSPAPSVATTSTHSPSHPSQAAPLPRITASPRARRYARQVGIALEQITGTGRHGRIRERDVQTAVDNAHRPANRLRQAIAKRMLAGVQEAAPVTLHRKISAGPLMHCRQQLKAAPVNGLVPTLNDCVLRLTCAALGEHPAINAVWQDGHLQPIPHIHLAFGVDTPLGLLAPVLHHAENKSLASLATSAQQLIAAARAGNAREQDLVGGTFTVTNLGNLGIDTFTPILNLPQVAILGVGRALQEPVVEQGTIVPGWTMQLSLTFDHRALDGATAARFLQTLTAIMESPAHWLTENATHPVP